MAKEASVIFRLIGRDSSSGPIGAVAAKLEALRARARAASKALGFDGIGRGFRGLVGSLGDVRSRLSGLLPMVGALGAGLSVAGFTSWMKGAAQGADGLQKFGQTVGWAADRLAGLQYALETTAGGSADQLKGSLSTLTRMMGQAANGIKGPIELFDVMNVRVRDANGAMRSSEAVLMDLADSMAKIKNPAERLAIAQAFFGEAGGAMAVLLEGGSKALRGAIHEGMSYAYVTETLAERSTAYNDSLSRLDLSFQGLRNRIAEGALPGLTQLNDALVLFAQSIPQSLIQRFNDLMGRAAEAMKEWFTIGEDGSSRASRAIEQFMTWVERSVGKIDEAVESIGGWQNAFLIFGAVLAGPFLISVGKAGFAMLSLGGSILNATAKLAEFLLVAAGGAIFTFIKALYLTRSLSLAISLAWAANPIGLIVLGVAALIGLMVALYQKCEPIRNFFNWLGEKLFEILDAMTFGLLGKALNFLGFTDDTPKKEDKRGAKTPEASFEESIAGYSPEAQERIRNSPMQAAYVSDGIPLPPDAGAWPDAATAKGHGVFPPGFDGAFAGGAQASGAGATMRALTDPGDLLKTFESLGSGAGGGFEAALKDPDGLLDQTTLSMDRKDRERIDRGLPVRPGGLPGEDRPDGYSPGIEGAYLPMMQAPHASVQAAAQSPPPKGEIVVRFDNAPSGTRIETRKAEGVDLTTNLNVGQDYAFSG